MVSLGWEAKDLHGNDCNDLCLSKRCCKVVFLQSILSANNFKREWNLILFLYKSSCNCCCQENCLDFVLRYLGRDTSGKIKGCVVVVMNEGTRRRSIIEAPPP